MALTGRLKLQAKMCDSHLLNATENDVHRAKLTRQNARKSGDLQNEKYTDLHHGDMARLLQPVNLYPNGKS